MTFYKITTVGVAALLLSAAAVQADDTLKVAISSDMRSTQFGVNRDGTTDSILHHVVEALVAARDNLEVGPALAKSWKISEDGRSYTFTLRDGALFHNGEPVTANEVKWSWERFLDPDVGFVCRKWFDGSGDTGIDIESIDIVDDATIRFTLTEPNPLFLVRMAHAVCLPGIVHPDSVGPNGEWIEPVGTGPYTISEWRRNQFIELEKFDGYVPLAEEADGYAGARQAMVDKVRFVVIGDPAATKSALLAGDVDVVPDIDLDAVEDVKKAGFETMSVSTPGWKALLLRNETPPMDDKRVRQAIAHAINRDDVTFVASAGLGKPNPSLVASNASIFGPEFETGLSYDLDKARELLQEAGYDGTPITISTNTSNAFYNMIAITVQSMLSAAGITAEIDTTDWATQLDKYSSGDYEMMVMSYSARPDPTLALNTVVGDKSERSNVVVDDPKIIAAVNESGAIDDPEMRRKKLVDIHKMIVEDSSIINLFNTVTVDAVATDVSGYSPWALGKPRFWGVKLAD